MTITMVPNSKTMLVAQTASIHAMATRLMERGDWDFGAVYYEGIDRFGHEFMEFHPPKMDAVSDEDFEAYRHCMTGIYRFHDMMLESLLALAELGRRVDAEAEKDADTMSPSMTELLVGCR